MLRLPPLVVVAAALAAGCAGTHRTPVAAIPRAPAEELAPAPAEPGEPGPDAEAPGETEGGVVHIVQPGQTLWRIARAYGVEVATIASANGIADPTRVEVGTPLFIPGATATIDVAPWPAPPPAPRGKHAPPPGPSGDFLWPVAGGEFLRPFGEPRPHHLHAGIDIRGALGQPILAARDGTVAFAGATRGGYGNMIVLDHGDGVQTVYAHAEKLLVKTGEAVRRGETIALVGRTGNATTEHCHFEIREENHPVDPLPFFTSAAQARAR
jgi:lipoprotein NlpD